MGIGALGHFVLEALPLCQLVLALRTFAALPTGDHEPSNLLARFSSRSIPDSVAGSMPEVRKCKEHFRSTSAPPERCNVGTFARPRKKDTAAATVPAATPVSQQLSCEQRWIMNGKRLDAPAKRKHNITIQYKHKYQYNTIQRWNGSSMFIPI